MNASFECIEKHLYRRRRVIDAVLRYFHRLEKKRRTSRLDPISRPRAMSSRCFRRTTFAERISIRRKFRESRFAHGVRVVGNEG